MVTFQSPPHSSSTEPFFTHVLTLQEPRRFSSRTQELLAPIGNGRHLATEPRGQLGKTSLTNNGLEWPWKKNKSNKQNKYYLHCRPVLVVQYATQPQVDKYKVQQIEADSF